jgi:hypothetical protein
VTEDVQTVTVSSHTWTELPGTGVMVYQSTGATQTAFVYPPDSPGRAAWFDLPSIGDMGRWGVRPLSAGESNVLGPASPWMREGLPRLLLITGAAVGDNVTVTDLAAERTHEGDVPWAGSIDDRTLALAWALAGLVTDRLTEVRHARAR